MVECIKCGEANRSLKDLLEDGIGCQDEYDYDSLGR